MDAMKWSSSYPDHPGYYLVREPNGMTYVVEVDVESDSHNLFYIRIPGDDHKHPLDLWQGASWCGPFSEH